MKLWMSSNIRVSSSFSVAKSRGDPRKCLVFDLRSQYLTFAYWFSNVSFSLVLFLLIDVPTRTIVKIRHQLLEHPEATILILFCSFDGSYGHHGIEKTRIAFIEGLAARLTDPTQAQTSSWLSSVSEGHFEGGDGIEDEVRCNKLKNFLVLEGRVEVIAAVAGVGGTRRPRRRWRPRRRCRSW